MYFIFSVIAPIFILIGMGYLAVKVKYFPQAGVAGLTGFVNNVAAPILLFRAVLGLDFSTAFHIKLVAPYFLVALLVFSIGIAVARVVFKQRPGHAVAIGFSGFFSNGLLIGLPVIQRAYGDEGLLLLFTILGIHAPILFTAGMITMELSRKDGQPLGKTFVIAIRNVLKQPLVIGICLGFIARFAGLELPQILDETTKTITLAVLPCALFGIGGALVQYKLSTVWHLAGVMALIKLVLQPFILWLVLMPIMGVEMEVARIFIVLAGIPTGINAFVFATYYDRAVNVATNVLLISTVGGFFSLSFWLWYLS
ncbi:MAG: AEC family transporter [Hyphomicrobiales bacterium]